MPTATYTQGQCLQAYMPLVLDAVPCYMPAGIYCPVGQARSLLNEALLYYRYMVRSHRSSYNYYNRCCSYSFCYGSCLAATKTLYRSYAYRHPDLYPVP